MHLEESDFFDWPRDKELPPDTHFGLLADVLDRAEYCVFCRLIAQSVSHTSYADDAEVLGCWVIGGVLESSDTVSLRLRIVPEMIAPEDAFAPFDIIPLGRAGTGAEPFAGRRVSADQMDLKLVKSWIQDCDEWHGSLCAGVAGHDANSSFSPFIRLLDCSRDCLVELQDPGPYIALSYVWGTQKVFRTLNDNIEQLKCPGELSEHRSLFPRTIQHAMDLAGILGYRYLWIDSLCIVQDNETDKAKQLKAMDVIYTRASLTIVAAGGDDANAGLSGLRPGSRNLTQVTAEYSPDLTIMAVQPDCQTALEAATWNTRGWTYQERLLSRRYLFFVNDTVYFQCALGIWGEDYVAEHPKLIQTAPMMDIILSRSWQPPTMTKRTRYRLSIDPASEKQAIDHLKESIFPIYCQIIAEYTARSMSYATDRLNGVSGILSVLARNGSMELLHGLPKAVLDAAILWRPQRELTRVPVNPDTGRPYWPSWSWAGWIGGVQYDPEDDYNGQRPLPSGTQRTRATLKLSHCHLENPLSAQAAMAKTGRPKPHPIDGLHIKSKVAKFRLTLFDRSGQADDPPGLCRFGISCSASGPSRPVTPGATGGGDEPWIGTIRLPKRYRHRLAAEYEFIILSESYNFSSDELGRQASRYREPYSIVNVMLVERLDKQRKRSGSWILDGNSTISSVEVSEVERMGVGRMLKDVWSDVDSYENLILV